MLKHGFGVAALCLALAACGSGTQQAPPPSAAAFVAAASRICVAETARGARVARLRALRPPAGGEDLYRRWLEAEQDVLAAADALASPPDTSKGDLSVALAIAEGKITGYARRLGAAACVTMPG